MKKHHLLIIDPQEDFCRPGGALAVPGADQDMIRLAGFIKKNQTSIFDIHVTLDTHHFFDISHPVFWTNTAGEAPAPFTIITEADVENGTWRASKPAYQDHVRHYVQQLAANKRYPLCIWPPHCLIGTAGHNVAPVLAGALLDWEKNQTAMVDYVTKGSNFTTEHYSAIQADVPDAGDPGTMRNTRLIKALESADRILLAGEALSHCLKFTVEDIADAFGESHAQKLVLLEDCTSPVPGFEAEGADFITAMRSRGMRVSTTREFSFSA